MGRRRLRPRTALQRLLGIVALGLGVLCIGSMFVYVGFTRTSGTGVSLRGGGVMIEWCTGNSGPMEGWPLENTWGVYTPRLRHV